MSGYTTLDPDPRTQTNEELAKRLERWANARDKRARHTREHQRGPGPTGTEILRVAAERLRQLDPTAPDWDSQDEPVRPER